MQIPINLIKKYKFQFASIFFSFLSYLKTAYLPFVVVALVVSLLTSLVFPILTNIKIVNQTPYYQFPRTHALPLVRRNFLKSPKELRLPSLTHEPTQKNPTKSSHSTVTTQVSMPSQNVPPLTQRTNIQNVARPVLVTNQTNTVVILVVPHLNVVLSYTHPKHPKVPCQHQNYSQSYSRDPVRN